MSTPQAMLGDSLFKNLVAKRQEKGELSLEDVGSILQDVAADFQAANGEMDQFLRYEITKMADYISKAKNEIAAISEEHGSESDKGISSASVHLDAVVKSTEKATNEIMDAADEIQAAAAGIGGDAEQRIMDASMRIYEACNFQDLTGQQINKVIRLITFLDERLSALTNIFTNAEEVAQTAVVPLKAAGSAVCVEGIDEKDLLNGPQLEQPSQADIDALFNSVEKKQ